MNSTAWSAIVITCQSVDQAHAVQSGECFIKVACTECFHQEFIVLLVLVSRYTVYYNNSLPFTGCSGLLRY